MLSGRSIGGMGVAARAPMQRITCALALLTMMGCTGANPDVVLPPSRDLAPGASADMAALDLLPAPSSEKTITAYSFVTPAASGRIDEAS